MKTLTSIKQHTTKNNRYPLQKGKMMMMITVMKRHKVTPAPDVMFQGVSQMLYGVKGQAQVPCQSVEAERLYFIVSIDLAT
ncbi:hypothetical protein KOW79_017929 [Hemibagrus wyckioides]|uniref:Uncharacterized protein n=1 Tax=Hemibagrus wyckioides TaxID=337641 RepID=A0A9D3N941_9TELE|nr:hypothetical protein KOW79_017929 [Hemibagrus wyckioides]